MLGSPCLLHLAWRWFTGLGFDQGIPHHSTFIWCLASHPANPATDDSSRQGNIDCDHEDDQNNFFEDSGDIRWGDLGSAPRLFQLLAGLNGGSGSIGAGAGA